MKKKSIKLKRSKLEGLTSNTHHIEQRAHRVDKTPRAIRSTYFIVKLVLLGALMFACGLGITSLRYPQKIVFIVAMGLLIAHATELVHQCLHRIAMGRAAPDNF